MVNILELIKEKCILSPFYIGLQNCPSLLFIKKVKSKPEVEAIKTALKNTQIDGRDLENFINDLFEEFSMLGVMVSGTIYDVLLSTLIIALEDCDESFAEKYLYDFAFQGFEDLVMTSEIARICYLNKVFNHIRRLN